jgi:small-conductance mechanosensitive channel
MIAALQFLTRDGIIAALILVSTVVVVAVAQHFLFDALARSVSRRSDVGAAIVARVRRAAGIAVPLFVIQLLLPFLAFPAGLAERLAQAVSIAAVLALGWAIAAGVGLIGDLTKARLGPPETEDARRAGARIDILVRTAITLVLVVTAALAAMTIPAIRTLGTTILASAGAAGLLVGLAARPVIENLFAGLQIALTEPIRVEDDVVVEGEQGKIEEIGAATVVVRLIDRGRLIVPLRHFLDKPFQNWSRGATSLTGSVLLWVDFATSVSEIRAYLPTVLAESTLWDGEVAKVQVVDAGEHAMQLRVRVSARTAADLFELRCEVREKLIAWIGGMEFGGHPGPRMILTTRGS